MAFNNIYQLVKSVLVFLLFNSKTLECKRKYIDTQKEKGRKEVLKSGECQRGKGETLRWDREEFTSRGTP